MGSNTSKKAAPLIPNKATQKQETKQIKDEPLQVQEIEEQQISEEKKQQENEEKKQSEPAEQSQPIEKSQEISHQQGSMISQQEEESKLKEEQPQQYFFRKALQERFPQQQHPLQSRQATQMSVDEHLNESIKRRMDQSVQQKSKQSIQREFYKHDFKVDIMIQESHLLYDQGLKGLKEQKSKDQVKVGHLIYSQESLQLVVREHFDLKNNSSRDCLPHSQVIGVDDVQHNYLINHHYSAADNLFLQRLYNTIKGRMIEVKGTSQQGYSFYDQVQQDKQIITDKLVKGLQQHRVFNQVMQSGLNIKNQLRVWDGTHHSQTKAGFEQKLLKVYSGHSEQLYTQQSVGKAVECCHYQHSKDMVFNYDSDVFVQLDFYQMQVLLGDHQPTLVQHAQAFSDTINRHCYSILSRIQRIPLIPLRRRARAVTKVNTEQNQVQEPMYSTLMKGQCSSRRLLSTLE